MNNIPHIIKSKIGKNLHNIPNHPICITKELVYRNFKEFTKFDNLDPQVLAINNFDRLLIPKDHPSRSLSDTYYSNTVTGEMLRTHTSAHQIELLVAGHIQFLVTGDVYRKDDIDATHYPVFHQIEGVSICENPRLTLPDAIDNVMSGLFPGSEWRWKEDYFPFTDPSWEVEVNYNGNWLEILGCGIIHQGVLQNAGIANKKGYAFGLGLDRIAMKLFDIPDIRFLWSEDPRFLNQFQSGKIVKFEPFSKYPVCYKDISMWVKTGFKDRDLFELIRNIGGDLVEQVTIIDTFFHKERGESKTFRISYRDLSRSLTNEEIDTIQTKIRQKVVVSLPVSLR